MFKKVLFSAGITMALLAGTLGMNCTTAHAVKAGNAINAVKPFYVDKVVNMLKENGRIKANATQEEIDKILEEYVNGDYAPMTQIEKAKKTAQGKVFENYIKQSSEAAKSKGLATSAVTKPDSVQPKDWTGAVIKEKVLAILVEYQDFKHNSLTANDTQMYYADFDTKHYEDLMFNTAGYARPVGSVGDNLISMKEYYLEQSGGSFTFDGTIVPWVTLSKNAAEYGANPSANSHQRDARSVVIEALKGAQDYLASKGETLADYDMNKDGVPDHIAIIYAGMGEEAGGGPLGTNAIWSHSSAVMISAADGILSPGTLVPYIMMPEDGAAGVFCHEFGHQIGVPDEYDTQYTGRGEPVGNWSIMADGSWAGLIPGTEPTGFSPKNKEFFQAIMPGSNWASNTAVLDYAAMPVNGVYNFALDQASSKGMNYSFVRVNLPAKTSLMAVPTSGTKLYYSGDNQVINPTVMATTLDLTNTTTAALSFKANYSIEFEYDLATVEVREVGTGTWTALAGNHTVNTAGTPAADFGPVGFYGSTDGAWESEIFNLDAYAGKNIELRFVYRCDSGWFEMGILIDDIKVTGAGGAVILADDVEGTPKFTQDGFTVSDGIKRSPNNYYIEWRNHAGVDMGLKNKMYADAQMEFDPGMVVWYSDDSFSDNWVGVHPGEGYIGVVDADQKYSIWKAADPSSTISSYARTGIQIHDAAFSLRKSKPLTMQVTLLFGTATGTLEVPCVLSDTNTFMNPVFDDSRSYFNGTIKNISHAGRKIPNLGIKVLVTGESKDRSVGTIKIVRTK